MNESRIVFSHQTAIDIIRCSRIHKISVQEQRHVPLPSVVPAKKERDALVDCMVSLKLESVRTPYNILIGSRKKSTNDARFKVHICTTLPEVSGLLKLAKNLYCSSVHLAFVQMANVLPLMELVELGYELCGSYSVDPFTQECAYSLDRLTSVRRLRGFVQRNQALRGADKALAALSFVSDGSASIRETRCAMLLGIPCCRGGYGLGKPRMNFEVECEARSRTISERRTLRCDLYWPSAKLDVEYQSHEYHKGELNRIRDSKRTNALQTLGFNVVQITDAEFEDFYVFDQIARDLQKRLGKRTYMSETDLLKKRMELRVELGIPLESRRTFEVG